MRFAVPLLLFVVVVGFLLVGLSRDPRELPSPLVGQPLPSSELERLDGEPAGLTERGLPKEVYILNVWASWCVACRKEHPLLVDLAAQKSVRLIGLNYKDERSDATDWLQRYGNPYQFSIHDINGSLGLDLGVYGVPETFVIDAQGIIRHKHIGPLDAQTLQEDVLGVVKDLRAQTNQTTARDRSASPTAMATQEGERG